MKNILIFAGLAGIAAAIAVYFTSENFNSNSALSSDYDFDDSATGYVTDADIEAYNMRENSSDPHPVS